MPLLRASIRLMARRATSLLLMRVQSSAKKSALQVISPWAARYCSTDFWRNRPGIRKKGDTACGSPMASREIEEGFASLREAIGDPQAVSPFFRIPGVFREKAGARYP